MGYYLETCCGGEYAAGGGCGAPRGFRKVSKETFEAANGAVGYEPFEHNNWECAFGGGQVKLVFSACSDCYKRY